MKPTTTKKLPYQDRLDARKAFFQARSREHRMRLQNNLSYAKKNFALIAGEEVRVKVEAKNPALGKVLGLIGVGEKTSDTRILRHPESGTGRLARLKSAAEEWLMPVASTIGTRKLLSCSLTGVGKVVRGLVGIPFKLLFGRKKKGAK